MLDDRIDPYKEAEVLIVASSCVGRNIIADKATVLEKLKIIEDTTKRIRKYIEEQ